MNVRICSAVLAPCLLTAVGCASMGLGPGTTEEQVIRVEKDSLPLTRGLVSKLTVDGTEIAVTTTRLCNYRDRRTVRRTTTRERFNQSPGTDYALGGLGLVAIGTGVGFVVDAKSVHPNEANSQNYNPVGPDNARMIGYGLIGAGAIATTIAIVDVVRSEGEDVDVQVDQLDAEVTQRNVPCKNAPYPDARVVGTVTAIPVREGLWLDRNLVAPQEVELGRTSKRGLLQVDVAEVLPADLVLVADKTSMDIFVGQKKVGVVDLAEVYRARRDSAWKGVDLVACQEPKSSTACDSVQKFVERYPDGKQAAMAQAALSKAQERLARHADDEAWNEAQADVASCTSGKVDEPSGVDALCARIENYASKYSSGAHLPEARAALKKASDRRAKLQAKLDKQERDQTAKVEREAKAAEQAEARRVREEERRQKAEEAKEAAKKRARCEGECKVACSSRWRNIAMCLQGCIQARCVGGDDDD